MSAVLLVFSAFFSSSETAVFSLTKLQVQHLRDDPSFLNQIILRFVDNPRRLLITSLLGNTFINTAFATLITSITLMVGVHGLQWSVATSLLVATAAGTLLLLMFGEISPKTIALRRPDRVARVVVLPLSLVSWILAPLRFVVRTVVDWALRLMGIAGFVSEGRVTEEDIRDSVTSGEASGIIKREERRLIDRVFHLREMVAKDVMVPRTDMACVDINRTVGEVFDLAATVGHSRIPVFEGGIDNIVGILHVKDLPRWRELALHGVALGDLSHGPTDSNDTAVRRVLRPPLLLPETKRVNALLRDFSTEGTYMAVLLDEYGGTAGLITVEDVIEEIVGEIIDEYDELTEPILDEELSVEALRTDGVRLPAKLSLRTASRVLQTTLDMAVADTIGGYVYSIFGRIPATGEAITDDAGVRFEVATMTGSRIQNVLVRMPRTRSRDADAKGAEVRS